MGTDRARLLGLAVLEPCKLLFHRLAVHRQSGVHGIKYDPSCSFQIECFCSWETLSAHVYQLLACLPSKATLWCRFHAGKTSPMLKMQQVTVPQLRGDDFESPRSQSNAWRNGKPYQQSNALLAERSTQRGRLNKRAQSPVPEAWAHLHPPITNVKPDGLAKPKEKYAKQKHLADCASQDG